MKKIYITPIAKEIQISEEENLLAGSPEIQETPAAPDSGANPTYNPTKVWDEYTDEPNDIG